MAAGLWGAVLVAGVVRLVFALEGRVETSVQDSGRPFEVSRIVANTTRGPD